jgi:sigma-E factor negative regulatory protein RseC
MIRHLGTVVAVDGDLAWVECARGAPCAVCPGRSACETILLANRSVHRLRARARRGVLLAPGARVVVGVPPGALVRASLLAYATPLGGLLAGTALGAMAAPALAYLGAAVGLTAGVVLATLSSRARAAERPVILDTLPS